jgi:hypothetical protein
MKTKTVLATITMLFASVGFAVADDHHGHCSGPNVCAGDAECTKNGFKELTKDECAKIEGSKFEASTHAGEDHKDDHNHDKK